MRSLFGVLFWVTAIFAVGIGVIGVQMVYGDGPLDRPTVVEVPRGSSVAAIADRLEESGVISNGLVFQTAVRALGVAGDLKAGDYAFDPGVSMEAAIAQLTDGDAIEHRVTVAEGLTSAEIVALLMESDVLTGDVAERPAEGSLAPDTYFVRRGETREAVVARMQAAQRERLETLWETRAEGLPLETPEEALILASIVEKETGVDGERAVVASVFINRLRAGWRLQSDPTTIYGITRGDGPLGRQLLRADVRAPSDYNTYTIDGLPPTPIASPGRDAIAAVLNPAETPYFFFVADGTGGHAFAETLEEHNRNVRAWRAIRDQ